MSLNDVEKINYITNNFHQYYDLTLNVNLETTNFVNLVIPIEQLTVEQRDFSHTQVYEEGYDIKEILNKYDDTEYEKEIICTLDRVIDGDTIVVDIEQEKDGEIFSVKEKVRFVGVNTPEAGFGGADVSTEFTEKALSVEDKIYLNIDDKKTRDKYGRLLAVVISNNKNINEVLLKEGLAEIWYIPPSEFNPYKWGDINTPIHVYESPENSINFLSPYLNADMTNLVFTPKDDYNTVYRYEVYKEVIYLKLNPFSQHIRMHILPKAYDCSNNLLVFKDDMLTKNNINISDDYHYYEDRNPINSYYFVNNEERDRDSPDISSQQYNVNEWENTFCDFSYNISNSTKSFNNLQICSGYRHNKTTPYYSVHYTGVRDNTNIRTEDRCTLIDANYDKITDKTNNITQYHYDENKNLYIPKNPIDIKSNYGDIDHINYAKEQENGIDCIYKLHRKTIKYINDSLYSEEDISPNNRNSFSAADWVDLSDK